MVTKSKWKSQIKVSLFTREWIEIVFGDFLKIPAQGLPLYEGVD